MPMEPLFELCVDDINDLLPHMKARLMSGTASSQVCTVERISMFLRNAHQLSRDVIVEKLVKFDVISAMCDVMQTSDENFVKVALECLELASVHKEFYENRAAMGTVEAMLRLGYCVNKSLKDSPLLERLLQGVCSILVRSSELAVDFGAVCIPRQIILFLKNMNIKDTRKERLKFVAVATLNVVLQRATFDVRSDEEEMIVDMCRDALETMTKFVKYGEDENTILPAAATLCGTCAGASRFCNVECEREDQSGDELEILQKKTDLSNCVYNKTMSVIIPYVKDADLSRVDPLEFHRNLISCLNNLYQLRNCNHDNLSNHLAANGYLKYFLRLTAQLPDNLRRSVCILMSRILSIIGKTAFPDDVIKLADVLRQGLLDLPKDSAERWNEAVASHGNDGTALMILLYYHFHATHENDMVSLQSLISRIMLLPKSRSISVFVLKPLWFLFAVTSMSHPCPSSLYQYENAVARLMFVLQHLDISEFYTHHVDLLRYCLRCPDVSSHMTNRILDLWLIESDGDIKPLLPFNCDKVVRHLLMVVQIGYPQRVISLAVKGLHHLIQISRDDQCVEQIADITWHMMPNILSLYRSDNVEHIEAVLKLANITQPHTMPMHLVTRSADIIVNILSKKSANSRFATLVVKQAYILLVVATSNQSLDVLRTYVGKPALLKELYVYGFSKERSELSAISVKLLAFIIHCQKGSSIKSEQPLMIHVRKLVELLVWTRDSPCCTMNGMQFICELLTSQDNDGSAIVLRKIVPDSDVDVDMLINLYEILQSIHVQKDPAQRNVVYQCLEALLHYCNAKVNALVLSHLCTVMSNYDLVSNVVNMRHASHHFVEFVAAWLQYRKANCHDIPWNARSLRKSPFDAARDQLKEYSVFVNEKGLKDASLKLQRVLSQYE